MFPVRIAELKAPAAKGVVKREFEEDTFLIRVKGAANAELLGRLAKQLNEAILQNAVLTIRSLFLVLVSNRDFSGKLE